jgi:site-specific recombinase XerD
MLFATYGMRAAEVANLRLDDLDWQRSQIRIRHAKNHRSQVFPLVSTVGNAILRYLRLGRPRCTFREIFINLTPPIKPISRGSLNHVVSGRMSNLGIRSLRKGPHSLRHACATHLLAEGFSMKHVGDQLGHISSKSTSTYAKVDSNQLRVVADFNFGGVL